MAVVYWVKFKASSYFFAFMVTKHKEEGDTDESSVLDEIIKLNAVLFFPVLGLRSLFLLVPRWNKNVCTEGFYRSDS